MHDDELLTETLRRGVSDLTTPFDTLATGAIASGRSIRRRRTLGAVVGGAACVGLLSVGTYAVSQLGSSAAPPVSGGFAGAPAATASATPTPEPTPADTTATTKHGVPVHLVLDGWTCDEFARDQKMWCEGPGALTTSIVWRPAGEYDAWTGDDPDRSGYVISEVHGDWFATIQPGPGVSREIQRTLVEHLVWE